MSHLKVARLSLSLTNALSIVAGSVGLNALIKNNQQQTRLHHAAPPGTDLIINVHDVLHSGITSTSISAAISAATFLFLVLHTFAPRLAAGRLSLRLQASLLAFFALWLFAAETAFTVFFLTRQAKVSASLDGVPIPQAAIAAIEKQQGVTRIYKDVWYLRLVAIIPWFTLISTIVSVIILFKSASATPHQQPRAAMKEVNSDDEKGSGV